MVLASKLRVITIFVSSPSDVKEARDKLDQVIDKLNRTVARYNGLLLTTFRWERDVVPEIGTSPQGVIDSQTGHYEVFIGIMWKRFGTPTDQAGSGTEHELRVALSQLSKPDAPRIMFYLCEKPFYPNDQDLEQMPLVKTFRKDLESHGIVTAYCDLEQFAAEVEEDLIKIVFDAVPGLGIAPRIDEPRTRISPEPTIPPRVLLRTATSASAQIRDLNPLERVPGRTLNMGLTDLELDYICKYAIDRGFIGKLTRKELEEFRNLLSESAEKRPQIRVGPFWLSRYPVTNEQFELFVAERPEFKTSAEKDKAENNWRTAYEDSGPKNPVTYVSFRDAEEFCKWAGGRLPSRAEFERAVRGLNDTLFPWGPVWEPDRCNDMFYLGDRQTSPVDAFREFASSEAICDLTGNVFEWVTDSGLRRGVQRVAGGAFNACAVLLGNAATSRQAQIDIYGWDIGFRYAVDIS